MAGPRFTPERRARFLGMIEAGATQEVACAAVGVTRATIVRWAAEGRKGKTPEAAAFAEALDRARGEVDDGRLAADEAIGLLEKAARKGSVRAIQLLLERPWEKKKPDEDAEPVDPMDELEGSDELAPRRKRRRAA